MRPNLSRFLWHHGRLRLSSCRTTCGIIANSIRCLVGQLAASLPTSFLKDYLIILLIIEQLWLAFRLAYTALIEQLPLPCQLIL